MVMTNFKPPLAQKQLGLEVTKLFMLSSAETEIYPVCWHFNFYEQDKLKTLVI